MDILDFEKAREFARSLNLSNSVSWRTYCKSGFKPHDIPYSPNVAYKNKGWESWGDWLGTGYLSSRKRNFLPYDEAKKFVHLLNLKTDSDWREYCRQGNKPQNIPAHPYHAYKNKGWITMKHWLGTSKEKFIRFEKAREFARSLGLKSAKEWEKYAKSKNKREDLPSYPDKYYKNRGWQGWGDWLGKTIDSTSIIFLFYEEAKKFVHTLQLQNRHEWKQYTQNDNWNPALPLSPDVFYKNRGWISWRNWLGKSYLSRQIKFRSFEEAREFIRFLKLKNHLDWLRYCKSGLKPRDIPSAPEKIYKYSGWKGWGDWLGSGTVCMWRKKSWTFKRARCFVHKLNIKTLQEWESYCNSSKKPKKIPSHPEYVYQNKGWKNWENWLGVDQVAFQSFKKAREFVHLLRLKDCKQWIKYKKSKKIPMDIPHNPHTVYKKGGWVSWGDWLGTGVVADRKKVFQSFETARQFVHSLNLKTSEDWKNYCQHGNKPHDIPQNPRKFYKNKGWISMADWLGASKISFRSFEKAREFARSLGLKSAEEWDRYCKKGNKPADIPTNVYRVYQKKGWESWGDWLGTGIISTWDINFISFRQARKFARSLKFKNRHEWHLYCASGKRPADIPANPNTTYKDRGWKGWGDWLGNHNLSNRCKVFRAFEEARSHVHSLKLKNFEEWNIYRISKKKPLDIPAAPNEVYAGKGWISYGDWLGTYSIASKHRTFWPYDEAKKHVHGLGLKSQNEWRNYCKTERRHKSLPTDPYKTYKKKGWISWGDWLGTGNIASREKETLPFDEAREFVHSLGVKNAKEWMQYAKSKNKPSEIPFHPERVYKNRGWISWNDWLGK